MQEPTNGGNEGVPLPRRWWGPGAVIFGTGAVYLALWALVGWAGRGYLRTSEAEVWRGMMCCQGLLWLGLGWFHFADIRALDRRSASFTIAVFALTLVMSSLAPRWLVELVFYEPAFKYGERVSFFIQCFTAVGALLLGSIAAVIAGTTTALRAGTPSFLELVGQRNRIRKSGASLSFALIVAVTSTAWLSRALGAMVPAASKSPLPAHLVLAYGLYFTALLAAIYVPAWVAYYQAATHFVDREMPMPAFDKAQNELRGELLKELGITSTDAFQGVLATLAPVVAAVVGVVGK